MVDCANQELQEFFGAGLPGSPDVALNGELVRRALNGFARKFFQETSGQYAGNEPAIEMLVAVNLLKKQTLLFRWVKNRVLWIPPSRHDCIGSGIIQLHPMLRGFQFVPTKETALFCGIRMMHHAKRIVAGVGGKTEAVALLDSGITMYFGTDNTERVEELVANFEEFIGKFVYTTVSNISTEFPEIEGNVAKNFEEFPKTFGQYRERYKELMNTPIQ